MHGATALLGKISVDKRYNNGDRYYGYFYSTQQYQYDCSTYHQSLSECDESVHDYPSDNYYYSVAVKCSISLLGILSMYFYCIQLNHDDYFNRCIELH